LTPVVVLGCDSNGYGVIRSVAKFNPSIPIIGIDYDANAPGLFSKYLYKKIIVSDPNKSFEKLLRDFNKLNINLDDKKIKPVVIITSDIFLNFFNSYRDILSEKFSFNIPDKQLLDNILDKRKQYELIRRLNIETPRTLIVKDINDDLNFDELIFPVFVKGAHPHKWKNYFTEKGFVAENKNQLFTIIEKIQKHNLEFIIQELIVGPNKNHYKVSVYYDKNRNPKLFFTTQKVRQFPYDFGVGSYMRSKRVEELISLGKKIFDALNYTGIGSIEFKVDERDGKFKFIELNPRMWQQNYQATLAGLNFAEYYYKDCIGQETFFNDQFLENVTYIDTVNDFQSFIYNKKITKENLFDWIKQVLGADGYAFYNWGDFSPILKSSNFGTKAFKYIFKSFHSFLKNK